MQTLKSFFVTIARKCALVAFCFMGFIGHGQNHFNSGLKKTIDSLYKVDQTVQYKAMNAPQSLSIVERQALFAEIPKVFTRHYPIISAILEQHGFPSFDLVGKESSHNFFVLVQHADEDVSLQEKALNEMKSLMANNQTSKKDFAYLTDRVELANGRKQIYGTQISFDENGKPFIDNLINPKECNKRRLSVGLGTIEEYLEKTVELQNGSSQDPRITSKKEYWVLDGNNQRKKTLIVCQGGPAFELQYVKNGKTNYRYIPNYSDYNVVYVHQAQTLPNKFLDLDTDFDVDIAQKAVAATVNYLNMAINHFKALGHKVAVVGNSYGAYIVVNHLANFEANADRYFVLAGRIDDNTEAVAQHLRGFNGEYAKNGRDYIPEKEIYGSYTKDEIRKYRVKQLLKGVIGQPRYSEKLKNKELSNVFFFYATNDENVGALSKHEITSLKAADARVFKTSDGHGEVKYRFIDLLIEGQITLFED